MVPPEKRNTRPDFTDPLAQTVINSLSAHIAILDREGVIVETNKAWHDYANKGEMTGDVSSVGVNYLKLCDATTGPEAEDARAVAKGIRSVIAGTGGTPVKRPTTKMMAAFPRKTMDAATVTTGRCDRSQ